MADLRFPIPDGADSARCKNAICGKTIFWIVTSAGKRMPVDPDGTSHFATCVGAAAFRKPKAKAPR